jgi:hypothetical protein
VAAPVRVMSVNTTSIDIFDLHRAIAFTAGLLDDGITSLAKRFGNAASQEGFVLDHENDQSSDTVCG